MNRRASAVRAARTVAGCLLLALLTGPLPPAHADFGEPTLAEEAAFRRAVDRVAAAVMRIEPVASAQAAAGEVAAAVGPSTGVVVASGPDAAWLVTTDFAVPPDVREAVVVRPDGGRLAARVAGRDESRRLVLLRTEPLPGLPELEAVPRRELAAGQWTVAVGRGWGHAAPGVTVGILSAVDRAWGRAVQTDASVSPANYGGPLLDIQGRVIGILAPLPADTAGMSQGTELYDAGIGFAVPFIDLVAVLPRLQAGERLAAGLLGITWRSRDMVNGPPVVASCRQGSPAAAAGLRPGDRIVRIGGREIGRIGDARHEIMPRRAGDAIDLVVERGAADAPARVEMRVTLVGELPPWRAAVLGLLPAPRGRKEAQGVAAEWLLPGGPAAQAGMIAGDVIRSVGWAGAEPAAGKVAIDSVATLAGALAGVTPGEPVSIDVVRGGAERRLQIITAAAPTEVPPALEGWRPSGIDPLKGPPAATIVRLESPAEPRPPLAVIPGVGRREPVGVLVYLGPPHGPVAEAEAEAWKAMAAACDVAVILPGSGDPRRWSPDDLPAIRRSLVALDAKRPLDATRIAVAGRAAGGGFAWFVAERLGAAVKGVAIIDAILPRGADLEPAEPGRSNWILLGPGAGEAARTLAADRRRLEAAGYPVGTIAAEGDALPIDLLGRWVTLLGLL
jgi:serine protease Do